MKKERVMFVRVLVVDDTKNIRLLLTKCLEMEGYEVETATEGQAALDMLAAENFELLFLDVKLPRLSGTEVLRRIREIGLSMPVVMMTAYATVKNAVDCTNLGAVAYLQKPFTSEKIKMVLEEVLHGVGESSLEQIISRARQRIDEGEPVQAENLLKAALRRYTLRPELYRLLETSCTVMGKVQEAVEYAKIAQALEK